MGWGDKGGASLSSNLSLKVNFHLKVFLLESQLEEEFGRTEDEFPTNEDEDHRTFFFVISSGDNQESMENTKRYVLLHFRGNIILSGCEDRSLSGGSRPGNHSKV